MSDLADVTVFARYTDGVRIVAEAVVRRLLADCEIGDLRVGPVVIDHVGVTRISVQVRLVPDRPITVQFTGPDDV